MLENIHHTAIICSNYEASKKFYVDVLGLEVIHEVYRKHRESYKLDLALNGHYVIELFSFPHPPKRATQPEACGLRHLAFAVKDIEAIVAHFDHHQIESEHIRVDEFTQKRFTFIADPDGLPIEFYEK